ncbi:MAG: hypothetical protein K2W96_16320 [Gemmataceae bacterium]|nr:hypothetical protein [Gemmataceae bacterium]
MTSFRRLALLFTFVPASVPAAAAPLPKGTVEMILRLDRREYVRHEPVWFTLEYVNRTAGEIGVPQGFSIDNKLSFELVPAKGEKRRGSYTIHPARLDKLPFTRLGAGRSVFTGSHLHQIIERGPLEPGEYTLHAFNEVGVTRTRHSSDAVEVPVESRAVKFTVRAPTAEEEETVAYLDRLYGDRPRWGSWIDGYDHLAKVALNTRSSRFRAAARLAQGERCRNPRLLPAEDDYDTSPAEAMRPLRIVLACEGASGMQKEYAALCLACCHHRSKQRGSATRTVHALRKVAADHPGTHAAYLAEGAIKRMRPLADKERARMRAKRP